MKPFRRWPPVIRDPLSYVIIFFFLLAAIYTLRTVPAWIASVVKAAVSP